eukprot:7059825-Prymnesium_polylepis.1
MHAARVPLDHSNTACSARRRSRPRAARATRRVALIDHAADGDNAALAGVQRVREQSASRNAGREARAAVASAARVEAGRPANPHEARL